VESWSCCELVVGQLKAKNPRTFWTFFVVASSSCYGELPFAFL